MKRAALVFYVCCAAAVGCARSAAADPQWTFLPLEGVRCGRSNNFGIGINKSAKSKRLLFFFLGGGACFDKMSCDRDCDRGARLCAANLDGFGAEQWRRENRSPKGTMFDRNEPTNPFRADHWVFLPYCTGDFHSGSRRADYGIDHFGWDAVSIALAKVVPMFPEVDHVVLYGVSAGGFGVVFNYEHARAAFPAKVKIDLVDDSGPLFSRARMPLQEEMRRSWDSAKHAPRECAACAEDWEKYLPFLAKKYPGARFSLLSYADDPVIAQGFGGPLADRGAFARALDAYTKDVLEPLPNVRYFIVPKSGHVLGKEQMSSPVAAGVTFADFIRRQVNGDPAWANVR